MKKTTKKDEFELVNLPKECQDPSISKDDFKLVQVDAKIHDQKFETKPTTFLKDCIKRFRKNKSSVVATFILGILVLMSLIVPTIYKIGDKNFQDIHDTSLVHPELYYLEPKLFDAGTGFWDGTKKMENIIVDTSKPKNQWGPDTELFNPSAISDLKIGDVQYIEGSNEYAHGGYFQLGYYNNIPSSDKVPYVAYTTKLNVAQLINPSKDPLPDNAVVRANVIEIVEVYRPTKIEQYAEVDILDFSVTVKYHDPDLDDDIIYSEKLPVDSIDLETDETGNITGTAHYKNKTKTFTIEVVEKEQKLFAFKEKLEVVNFVSLDQNALKKTDETIKEYPKGYVDAESALYLVYYDKNLVRSEVQITDYKKVHNIGISEEPVNITEKFKTDYDSKYSDEEYYVSDIQIEMRVKNANNKKNSCTLIKSLELKSHSTYPNEKARFRSYSFSSGNGIFVRTNEFNGSWITSQTNNAAKYTKATCYLVKAVMCSFTYDTYEAVLGKVKYQLSMTELENMATNGIVSYSGDDPVEVSPGEWKIDPNVFEFKILDKGKCPLVGDIKAKDFVLSDYGSVEYIDVQVYRYKIDPYFLSSMPRFLLGTDKSGKDMFVYVFEGLRTSLLLGIATSAICFLFGLLWGSIAGYFGGNVDLIMERFTDILAGVPWIVVMTLTIIHLGSTFFTFALALCLTGWIGTAATTRTQFYRFRGREYVLASRTLGASHARLISKHILPNAMGTIITSAVLMVPSIIFSEATISYLGLGFQNLASLGVILSDNQIELTNHPYLLIFPAVIIALLMISFNLFGNGLRDAVNPSLKGEGE